MSLCKYKIYANEKNKEYVLKLINEGTNKYVNKYIYIRVYYNMYDTYNLS